MGDWAFRSDSWDPALVRCFDGPDPEGWREAGLLPVGYVFWVLIPEIFGFVRTFAPENSKKIAAKVGKSALWCRSHDEGGAGHSKWIRSITSRSHGPKFFSGKNFGIESLWAGFFSARKFFRPNFFGSKFEKPIKFSGRKLKKEKKVGAKVGKKVVSLATD